MKLVIISDTHNKHKQLEKKIPDGDVLIHAGDMTGRGLRHELESMNAFFKRMEQRFEKVIYCAGNHDFMFQDNPLVAKEIMQYGTYLQDKALTFKGVKFYGSPWQPTFYNWAFNANRGYDIAQHWIKIPTNTDILITHCPPHGILDTVSSFVSDLHVRKQIGGKYLIEHVGCRELMKVIEIIKPKVHAFGHIHNSYGIQEKDGTIFVNGANCNEMNMVEKPPIVVEIQ